MQLQVAIITILSLSLLEISYPVTISSLAINSKQIP